MSARKPKGVRLKVSAWTVRSLAAAAGIVVAYHLSKSLVIAVVSGVVCAGFAGSVLRCVLNGRRGRKERQRENTALRRVRLEDSLRLFWESSRDFVPGAWGRRDLETLRLLCLNLEKGERLGDRVSQRLRAISSGYLAGTVDRLADVVTTSRLVRLDTAETIRLEGAAACLTEALETAAFRSGEVVSVCPDDIAEHVGVVLDASLRLRNRLAPRVVADLPAVLSWLVAAKHQARVASGKLSVNLEDLASNGMGRVVMRPFDLSRVLDDLLTKVFANGRVDGRVEIRSFRGADRVDLTISWHVDDRFRFYPGALLESSRIIGCYEGLMDLSEDPETSGVVLTLSIPAIAEVSDRTWSSRASGLTG